MGKYFLKKRIFALIFIISVFGYAAVNAYNAHEKLINSWNDIENESITDKVVAVEADINEEIYGKDNFIETFSYMNKLMGKHEINEFEFIKDKKGYLLYSSFFRENTEEEFEYALRIKNLKYKASEYGAETIFIMPPDKYIPSVTEVYEGMPINNVNHKTDELLMWLYRFGVNTIDYREYLPNANISYDETFYKTDHHWTILASFEASKILIDELNKKFGAELNIADESIYDFKQFSESMIGSISRRVGINFSGVDDFTAIIPNCDNEYNYSFINLTNEIIVKEGATKETIIKEDVLDDELNDKYDTYLGGMHYYDSITNLSNKEGPTALFIRDSYASPMITFLAPLFSKIDAVWCLEDIEELDIEVIVENNVYDYIIIQVYPYNIKDEAFNYYK